MGRSMLSDSIIQEALFLISNLDDGTHMFILLEVISCCMFSVFNNEKLIIKNISIARL